MTRLALVALVLATTWSAGPAVPRAGAQTTQAAAHRPSVATAAHPAADSTTPYRLSGVVGVVVDSVHGGPLMGAVVTVSGTARQATTDSAGQFRIDSVPPGAFSLGIAHPMLDSLGIAISTQPVAFPLGRYAVVRLATPSSTALIGLFCPPEKRITGPGVLMGRVRDADSDAPATGARVALTWMQIEVGSAIGLRRMSRVRTAIVDSTGSYRICGLPDNLGGTLRASRAGQSTAGVAIRMQGQPIVLASLYVPSPDTTTVASADAAARADTTKRAAAVTPRAAGLRHGSAVALGRVLDPGAHPIEGAEVSVAGAAATAVTNDSGVFTLRGLPTGTQELDVRKLTFNPTASSIDLTSRAPRTVTVVMRPAPPTLAKVTTTTPLEKGLMDVGFTNRKKAGMGHYLTEDEVAEKQPMVMSDIFTTIPGITVSEATGQPVITSTRGGSGCVNYYVDGVPYTEQTPGDFDEYMRPDEVAAVEVYNSVDAPAQFEGAGTSSCAVIVVWTKTKVGG